MKKKLLIFDIGDTIYNEDYIRFVVIKSLIDFGNELNKNLSFEMFISELKECSYGKRLGFHYELAKKILNDQEHDIWKAKEKKISLQRDKYINLFPDFMTFARLAQDKYIMGIIANQPREMRNSLEKDQVDKIFHFIGLSEEVGLKKPNIEFLKWGIQKVDFPLEDIYMIGDRLDNDISPANQLGINTIHFDPKITEKGWTPRNVQESLYIEHLGEHPNFSSEPKDILETPNLRVSNFTQILDYLQQFETR